MFQFQRIFLKNIGSKSNLKHGKITQSRTFLNFIFSIQVSLGNKKVLVNEAVSVC